MPVLPAPSLRVGALPGVAFGPTRKTTIPPKLFTLDEANRLLSVLEPRPRDGFGRPAQGACQTPRVQRFW